MKFQRVSPLSPGVALAALLCLPLSSFAGSSSILASSSSFALLGGSAVTNTGVSTISNGDVGSPTITPGAMAINNGSQVTTGSELTNGLSDFSAAATGLSGMTPMEDLSTINGGNLGGQTLLPGVYFTNSTVPFTGTLTLNANGVNNAYWVFQFGAAFTTAASSTVVVTGLGITAANNGSEDGIFWDDEVGGITIGASSIVLGNYLSAAGGVTFGSGTDGSGGARGFAQAGTTLTTTTINTVATPGGDWTGGLKFSGNNVVPVPEPAAFLWLAPLGAIGFALWRRRSVVKMS